MPTIIYYGVFAIIAALSAGAAYPRRNPSEYVGPQLVRGTDLTVAEAQREAHGDIEPMLAQGGVSEIEEHVRTVLKGMDIEILDETEGQTSGFSKASTRRRGLGSKMISSFGCAMKAP